MRYLWNTSICVYFLRGKLNLDETLKSVAIQNCYIFEISVAELRFGAENSIDSSKSHKALYTKICTKKMSNKQL